MFIVSTDNSAVTLSSFSKALEYLNQVLFFRNAQLNAKLIENAYRIGKTTYDNLNLVIERV